MKFAVAGLVKRLRIAVNTYRALAIHRVAGNCWIFGWHSHTRWAIALYPPDHLHSEISLSRTCNIPIHWKTFQL